MEHVIKYFVVELTTNNPSADDTWNFRSKEQADAYAEEKRRICKANPDIYGEAHVRVYDTAIIFCDD